MLLFSCKGQIDQKIESFEFLKDQELKSKSVDELRLLRNEVFARKGYVFKSTDLQDYFKNKPWYKPDSNLSISITDEEKIYINKIKGLENTFNKITDCINHYSKEKERIYPITSDKIKNNQLPDNLINIELPHNNLREEIKQVLFDGSIFKLDCAEKPGYRLIITNYPDENLHVYLVVGDVLEIKKLHGTFIHDFRNVDEYIFVLDHNDLEIIKTNYTYTNDYMKKEISKETKKYKLTDLGLVEL